MARRKGTGISRAFRIEIQDALTEKCNGRCSNCNALTLWGSVAEEHDLVIDRFKGIITTKDGEFAFKLATVQHIIPRCEGGTYDLSNLTLFCYECNYLDGQIVASRRHYNVCYKRQKKCN